MTRRTPKYASSVKGMLWSECIFLWITIFQTKLTHSFIYPTCSFWVSDLHMAGLVLECWGRCRHILATLPWGSSCWRLVIKWGFRTWRKVFYVVMLYIVQIGIPLTVKVAFNNYAGMAGMNWSSPEPMGTNDHSVYRGKHLAHIAQSTGFD